MAAPKKPVPIYFQRLVKRRNALGLKPLQLHERIQKLGYPPGFNPETQASWRRGKKAPGAVQLIWAARALEVSPEWLAGVVDEPNWSSTVGVAEQPDVAIARARTARRGRGDGLEQVD